MTHWWFTVSDRLVGHRMPRVSIPRSARRAELSCQPLEERVTPSHFAAAHHLVAAVNVHHEVARHSGESTGTATITAPAPTETAPLRTGLLGNTGLPDTAAGRHEGRGSSSTNTALQTALQNLAKQVQTIELASGTTVGELTAIRVANQTLATDKLTPSSYSALQSFENSLVTTNATTPGSLTGNSTLQAQFAALYTSTPTTQQTTDLNTAYNALAAAVTSAGITSADITAINTAWSAVLTASNSTSTATFPYFTLATGQGAGACMGAMAF